MSTRTRTQFTRDNTDGYSAEQLLELNRRFDERAAAIDPTSVNAADERKHLAERVLAEFDDAEAARPRLVVSTSNSVHVGHASNPIVGWVKQGDQVYFARPSRGDRPFAPAPNADWIPLGQLSIAAGTERLARALAERGIRIEQSALPAGLTGEAAQLAVDGPDEQSLADLRAIANACRDWPTVAAQALYDEAIGYAGWIALGRPDSDEEGVDSPEYADAGRRALGVA